tara:strand:- start:276 stop:677 length:402 start_codon:yes stop_codon:yes gene_type:complete
MKLINEVLKEKTEQNDTLDIYIKDAPHSDTTPQEWVKNKTHLYVVVFHFTNVKNPYYAHSYYIDTVINSSNKGLCLNGSRWNYESISVETYERVKNFCRKFVLTNQLNIEHSKIKYIDETYIYSYGGKWNEKR